MRQNKRKFLAFLNRFGLAVACIIVFTPFLWMVATSLKPDNEVADGKWLGSSLRFENYSRAIEYFPFGQYLFNSLFVTLIGTVGVLLTSSLSAYAFSRLRFRGRDKLFGAYLATLMVPQQVVVVPMFLFMRELGWVDSYMALIIPFVFTAFGTFLLRQNYLTIPYEVDEAAIIDGCNHFQVYWRILLPMIRPGLATLAVFTFITYWNNFLWPLIILNDQNLYTLPIGLQAFHGQYSTAWNLLMAGATMTTIPSLIFYLFAQRYISDGIATSGLGGR
ncbi:carbohydrate ABC transporter permease [Gracilibacillus alcaliphilus]|uniref:carbohydrate ABC transporter permease n=1 Tax=Gracilibacillus alcaliphilus TaxID=1401441 RepID=UPI00195E35F4|nr:carbohydrate ABC transporter permease [Gracilibacillus alcaliphilus]MBM7676753.1 multiple sugar transport system permease protein [Gracilibacillus alcaliphilus]